MEGGRFVKRTGTVLLDPCSRYHNNFIWMGMGFHMSHRVMHGLQHLLSCPVTPLVSLPNVHSATWELPLYTRPVCKWNPHCTGGWRGGLLESGPVNKQETSMEAGLIPGHERSLFAQQPDHKATQKTASSQLADWTMEHVGQRWPQWPQSSLHSTEYGYILYNVAAVTEAVQGKPLI